MSEHIDLSLALARHAVGVRFDELSPEQMYRPLAEGGCDFVKK